MLSVAVGRKLHCNFFAYFILDMNIGCLSTFWSFLPEHNHMYTHLHKQQTKNREGACCKDNL